MKTKIQALRIKSGVTLRELAQALGPHFSTYRLSMAERALISIPALDEQLVLAAIDRLGPLCAARRRIRAVAREIDFSPFLSDLREGRSVFA